MNTHNRKITLKKITHIHEPDKTWTAINATELKRLAVKHIAESTPGSKVSSFKFLVSNQGELVVQCSVKTKYPGDSTWFRLGMIRIGVEV